MRRCCWGFAYLAAVCFVDGAQGKVVEERGSARRLGCDARRLGRARLERLAALSAPRLVARPEAGAATRSAVLCTDASERNVAVAIEVPPDSAAELRGACRRGAYCAPRHRAAHPAEGRRLEAEGGWFAACVPIECLGDDTTLRAVAWRVLWRRLASVWKPRDLPAGEPPEVLLLRLFGDARSAGHPERPLAEEVLEGAGEEGPFDLVTVTDSPDQARLLRNSVKSPLRLRILRPPGRFRFRWFDTERYLLSYVAHLRRRGLGDRLVFYVDAFDTAWFGCQRNLTKAFEAMGRPMFFGVEFDLYPAGLAGYPAPVADHQDAADRQGARRLSHCQAGQIRKKRWDTHPPEEHEPCLGRSNILFPVTGKVPRDPNAVYLNGGAYGGRAWALEAARNMLHLFIYIYIYIYIYICMYMCIYIYMSVYSILNYNMLY